MEPVRPFCGAVLRRNRDAFEVLARCRGRLPKPAAMARNFPISPHPERQCSCRAPRFASHCEKCAAWHQRMDSQVLHPRIGLGQIWAFVAYFASPFRGDRCFREGCRQGGDSAPCALLVRCKTVVARSSGVLLISTKIGREAGVGSAPALICDAAEHPKRVGSARSGPVWLVLRRIWLRSPGTARASRLLLQLLCCLRLRSCLLIAPKNACPFLPFPAMVRSVPT